ncbi:8-oxo-dGTP diphosphatase [Halostagnicola sp. A-GB9-2]|uniref:8-oxo-dGTP diphosphatase n=1 Tax=Halostagnicola sp. A-GB9-2 TaxID=3048066 RepID=UPI0024C0AA03|nr:8-oxo-dGTP diphosphatase [Halostagnicola sp. A-GB9-2]MDJ1432288.1 8-oxo-dGTP diphosphatase [Halostagnicola sp. A-GB9-2]
MIEATLCFVVRDGCVLLIEKRRGLGEGLYNGPGGKLEDGETPRACAIRETREEVGIEVSEPEKAGTLEFVLDGSLHTKCHVFRTDSFDGEPTMTAEARPEWFAIDDVPYDRMWEDDRYWLPGVLEGKTVAGQFRFAGGEPLDEAEFVDYDLEWSVSFPGTHR